MRNAPPSVRFAIKTELCEDTGCIVWTAKRNAHGYGVFFPQKGQPWLAHRWAWTQSWGPIPDGLSVMHTCDNPACVRVAHLRLGTHADNMRDMAAKGRGKYPESRGEANAAAKLTAEQVETIRREYVPRKVPLRVFAERYGVTEAAVSMIVNRKRWR